MGYIFPRNLEQRISFFAQGCVEKFSVHENAYNGLLFTTWKFIKY